MFSLAEAVHYLRTRGSRRAMQKLLHGYISGRRRIYLLWSDYEALATMPLADQRLTFRFARPQDFAALAERFPQVRPQTFEQWLGQNYFLYLALAGEEPAALRCDSMVVSHSIRPILRLRADQVFMEDIATAPAFRRQGITRQIRIAMAREMMRLGYRSSWGLQLPMNRKALEAFDRTPEVIERVGTITRTSVLGHVRYRLTLSRWLSADHIGTLVQVVADLLPRAPRVALLFNPGTTKAPPGAIEAVTRAAAKRGVELRVSAVTDAEDQIGAFTDEFAQIARQRADAVIVLDDPMYRDFRDTIVGLASRHRLPALYEADEFVRGGGLASYAVPSSQQAPLPSELDPRAIILDPLGGARPGLMINLKTARSLGLAIPPSVLLRADRVIE